ncbi:hypothetical protein [Actinoplanes sp. NBRC 103695]|uniref:hypothetical protein n=1 Tax=Actinoplanes sp. NBRC 103695 TaxID=3032202 RepID=UPI0025526B93|nr:hypothetical protein [Actinoplanes sp. NBRC 103695]
MYRGSLDDLDSLRRGVDGADGVLHMGYGGDFDEVLWPCLAALTLPLRGVVALPRVLVG